MTQSATNFRGGARKILGKKRSRTCKKKQQGGNNPLSSMLGQSHMIKCEIVEAGKDGKGDDKGVTFSPGSAKGPNLAVLKQMLLKDKAFMSKLAPKGVGGPSDDKVDDKGRPIGKKVDKSKPTGEKGRYRVKFSRNRDEQMQIIRQFEELFFSFGSGTSSNAYYFQKIYSSQGTFYGPSKEKAPGVHFMKLFAMLFLIKIFKKELADHEKTENVGADTPDNRKSIIDGMDISHDFKNKYSVERRKILSFYSFFAPSEGSSYTNAKPFYEKLQNLFDKGGVWDNANSEYEQIIKLINHEFFDDVYDNEKNSVERARVFKYKLLLFASYYNTISNKEAKSSFSKYGPNRKMLNDIKLRLFGNKTDTSSGRGYRSLSIDKAIAYMFGGLDRLNFQNGWNGELFSGAKLENNINVKISNETQAPTQDEIDNVKNLIKNIKVDGNQLETEMLPFKYEFKDTNKIDITQEGQEGGGNIGLGGENYKLENWGALQILGYLLEGQIVLQKYINNDPGFTVNNLGDSKLKDSGKLLHVNEFKQLLEVYTDKYFEIITGRYIPGILGTKRNVKAVGMRSDSVVGDYRNARYKIQLVQSHLLLALYYFSRLYYPDGDPADECKPENIKILFKSYGVEGTDLKDSNNKYITETDDITGKNLDFDKIIELQNELFEAIGKKYDELLKDYNEKTESINKKLGESTSEAELLKSKGFDKFLKKMDDKIKTQDNYLTAIINGTTATQSGGGDFNFKEFGIPNLAQDNEFKDNLKGHTNFLEKKLEDVPKTEDLKIYSSGEADKIPKKPEKPVSIHHEDPKKMKSEFYKTQYEKGIEKLNESFESIIPTEEGTAKVFLTKIKDGLNKNKDDHLKFIQLWIRIIGKLEPNTDINSLIIFKQGSLELPNSEEYLTNSEYKQPWKSLVQAVEKVYDQKKLDKVSVSDLAIFYGHNLGNDTPKEMTSLAETKAADALNETTIEDVKKIFDPKPTGNTEELENLDQEGYDELLKLREKFLGEDIFKEGSFGNSFYDAIIKSPNYSLDKRVENLWFMKLVKSLIDLNEKIKGELDEYKKTILGNVQFVNESKKLFEKAIDRKKAEKEGLKKLTEFENTRLKSFTDEIETQKKRLNDDITRLDAEKKTLEEAQATLIQELKMKKSELNTESRVTIQTKIESIKNAAGQEPSPVTKPNITEIQTDFNLHKKMVLLAEAEKKAAEDELVQLEQDKVALDKGTNDLNNEKGRLENDDNSEENFTNAIEAMLVELKKIDTDITDMINGDYNVFFTKSDPDSDSDTDTDSDDEGELALQNGGADTQTTESSDSGSDDDDDEDESSDEDDDDSSDEDDSSDKDEDESSDEDDDDSSDEDDEDEDDSDEDEAAEAEAAIAAQKEAEEEEKKRQEEEKKRQEEENLRKNDRQKQLTDLYIKIKGTYIALIAKFETDFNANSVSYKIDYKKNNLNAIPYEEGEDKEEVNTLGFYAVKNMVTGEADDGETKWDTIMNKVKEMETKLDEIKSKYEGDIEAVKKNAVDLEKNEINLQENATKIQENATKIQEKEQKIDEKGKIAKSAGFLLKLGNIYNEFNEILNKGGESAIDITEVKQNLDKVEEDIDPDSITNADNQHKTALDPKLVEVDTFNEYLTKKIAFEQKQQQIKSLEGELEKVDDQILE